MKYLDETGLSHFWNKIKETIPDDYISAATYFPTFAPALPS